MVNILFICTANVFRSMSAHYLLKEYANNNNLDIFVDSAGIVANPYDTPYPQTLQELFNLGVNAYSHKNKKINQELIDWADYIIGMTTQHKRIIEEDFDKKVYLFNELAFDKKTNLLDESEARFAFDLDEFIEQTVAHINSGIPEIAKKVT